MISSKNFSVYGVCADGERLGHVLHQRLGLEVLVVGHVAAGGQVEQSWRSTSTCTSSDSRNFMNVDGVVDALAALRDDDEVAADERGGLAGSRRPAAG